MPLLLMAKSDHIFYTKIQGICLQIIECDILTQVYIKNQNVWFLNLYVQRKDLRLSHQAVLKRLAMQLGNY